MNKPANDIWTDRGVKHAVVLYVIVSLLQVRATDEDAGENAIIEYAITSGNDAGIFQIDARQGTIVLALDAASLFAGGAGGSGGSPSPGGDNLTYSLGVTATDGGQPTPMSTQINLSIVFKHLPPGSASSSSSAGSSADGVFMDHQYKDLSNGGGGEAQFLVVAFSFSSAAVLVMLILLAATVCVVRRRRQRHLARADGTDLQKSPISLSTGHGNATGVATDAVSGGGCGGARFGGADRGGEGCARSNHVVASTPTTSNRVWRSPNSAPTPFAPKTSTPPPPQNGPSATSSSSARDRKSKRTLAIAAANASNSARHIKIVSWPDDDDDDDGNDGGTGRDASTTPTIKAAESNHRFKVR